MSDADQELIGRTLGGRFRLTGYIGSGAMASVFRAEQEAEPRELAVKVMHRELLAYPELAARFRREARVSAPDASCCSMRSSTSSDSLHPWASKNLMPLSS